VTKSQCRCLASGRIAQVPCVGHTPRQGARRVRIVRISGVGTLHLTVLLAAACMAQPQVTVQPEYFTTVQPEDFPHIMIECTTTPRASPGACEGWGVSTLDLYVVEASASSRLVLKGPMGPGRQGCRAEFYDLAGSLVASTDVPCWVPSGG
jgi:hypothetical protein